MTPIKKKVLFILHNAGRTGAPLMLLNVLKWWKQNTDIPFEILLRETGPLREEFSTLAPTNLYQGPGTIPKIPHYIPKAAIFTEFLNKMHHKQLLKSLRASGIGLIYSNTITNGDILETLAPLGCPTISHVHELNYWIEMSGEKNLAQVKQYSDRYIAASGAVKTNLVNKYSIPEGMIDVVHSFIPTDEIKVNPMGIRQKFDIPADAFVILGSGHETWRKGKDLFVQLAALTIKDHPNIKAHFLWVGGWQKEEDHRNILHDVQHLGLTKRVHFTGEVNNPLDYFAAGDIFAMVSREDPFPLVSLEAALLEKPVLCFAGAGGMPEFVEDDAGYVIPYLDINVMSKNIAHLAQNRDSLSRMGLAASLKVKNKFCLSIGAKKIIEVVKRQSGQ